MTGQQVLHGPMTNTANPKPCCLRLNLTFSCGHTDSKFVKFTQTGKPYRLPDNYELQPPPELSQDAGNMTPMPYTRAVMDAPQYARASAAAQRGSFNSTCASHSSPSGSADFYTVAAQDGFNNDHSHPQCGLFHLTNEQVKRPCPGRGRREMCEPASEEMQKVKQELRKAIKLEWSRETVDYLKKKLEEAEVVSRIHNDFGELFMPFTEDEEDLTY